jgi:hypothetical protein
MLSFKDYYNALNEKRFDASHRDKLAKAKRGKRLSSATRDKISDTMKGTSNFAGKKHTKADKVKIKLSRGHDDRVDGRKWIVKKGDGNTYRKYSLPNRYDYQYGRSVKRDVNEASYANNVGVMELIKFNRLASTKDKNDLTNHIKNNRRKEISDLIHKVTGIRLHPSFINKK